MLTNPRSTLLLAGAIGLVALGIFVIFDLLAAISLYGVVTLVYALFWGVVLGMLLYNQSRGVRISMMALFLAAILLVYGTNWNSRKQFLRHFNQIQVGMTLAEVDQVMAPYQKEISPASQVDEQNRLLAGTISYSVTTGPGDLDVGLLVFEEGRVVNTTFHPD